MYTSKLAYQSLFPPNFKLKSYINKNVVSQGHASKQKVSVVLYSMFSLQENKTTSTFSNLQLL